MFYDEGKMVKLYLHMPWRHIEGVEVQCLSFLTCPVYGGA